MKKYLSAVTNATHDIAKFMTYDLRSVAVREGWEPEVASGLSISYDGNKFAYNLGDQFSEQAFNHEFGTETTRPKATVRRYLNDLSGAQKVMGKLIEKHVKESK